MPSGKKPTGKPPGGPQPNSGRKPKALTQLKQALISEPVSIGEKQTAADYAFRLFVRTMRDEDKPIDLRLDCGREIMNRSWGKPTERKEVRTEATKGYEAFDPDDV